jgi:hypothetical protein
MRQPQHHPEQATAWRDYRALVVVRSTPEIQGVQMMGQKSTVPRSRSWRRCRDGGFAKRLRRSLLLSQPRNTGVGRSQNCSSGPNVCLHRCLLLLEEGSATRVHQQLIPCMYQSTVVGVTFIGSRILLYALHSAYHARTSQRRPCSTERVKHGHGRFRREPRDGGSLSLRERGMPDAAGRERDQYGARGG